MAKCRPIPLIRAHVPLQPYKLSDTPEALINRWGEATFHYLADLFTSHEAEAAGVQMAASYLLYTKCVAGASSSRKVIQERARLVSCA